MKIVMMTPWNRSLTKHRLEAIEDTTLFEVSTPELEDTVRLQDDYGRAK